MNITSTVSLGHIEIFSFPPLGNRRHSRNDVSPFADVVLDLFVTVLTTLDEP